MFTSRQEFTQKVRSIDEATSTWSPRTAYAAMKISDYYHWLTQDQNQDVIFRIYYKHPIEGFVFPVYMTSETEDSGEGFLGSVFPDGDIVMGAYGARDEIIVHPSNLPYLGIYPEVFERDDGSLYYLDLDEDEISCVSPEDCDGDCNCCECCHE